MINKLKNILQSSNDGINEFKKEIKLKMNIKDDTEYEEYASSLFSKSLLTSDDHAPFIIKLVENKRILTSEEIERLVDDIQNKK